MTIAAVDVTPCIQRQEDPSWRFALATVPSVEGWLITIRDEDGTTGHGYAQSLPHIGSTYHGVKGALDVLTSTIVGREPTDVAGIMWHLDRALDGNVHAKAGIDCALHDLVARKCGVPLHVLFGGKVRDAVDQIRIVPIKTPEEMADNSLGLVERGYSYLKIKVHGDVAEDVARVREIRRRVGDHVHLTIDANQAYTPKSAIAALRRGKLVFSDRERRPLFDDGPRPIAVALKHSHCTTYGTDKDGLHKYHDTARALLWRAFAKPVTIEGWLDSLQARAS